MAVITNTTLLVRRIGELQRRREGLLDRQDRLRRSLPEWAFAPLQLVGMSADEIRRMMSELSKAETEAGLDEIEKDLEQIDSQLEELENLLLATPARSLDSVQAVLDLAVARFRGQVTTDPNDVFYDYGDARVLAFLERASDDLRGILNQAQRYAS
jgi:hypothetical protein